MYIYLEPVLSRSGPDRTCSFSLKYQTNQGPIGSLKIWDRTTGPIWYYIILYVMILHNNNALPPKHFEREIFNIHLSSVLHSDLDSDCMFDKSSIYLDRFSMGNHIANRSRLIPVTVCTYFDSLPIFFVPGWNPMASFLRGSSWWSQSFDILQKLTKNYHNCGIIFSDSAVGSCWNL